MSSSDRRSLVLGLAALPLALAGCFRPMLAKDGPVAAIDRKIALPPIEGRFGYFLSKSLEDRLGTPLAPEFELSVRTSLTERGLAVAQDNAVTRVTLVAEAAWSLRRLGETDAVLEDTVSAQSGYNATASLYATRQARLDIERRLARELGERIARLIQARADKLVS